MVRADYRPTAAPHRDGLARGAAQVRAVLGALDQPCWVVRDDLGVAVSSDETNARQATVLAVAAPMTPEVLGSPGFRREHGTRQAYMTGAMAGGIASADLVVELARSGYLASFGAAGLQPRQVDEALTSIRARVGEASFACNLIHSPQELALEGATVDACLRHQVRCVEASAFLDLTAEVVRYRAAGLHRDRSGRPAARNRLIAKVSRAEVAECFLRPAPEAMLRRLVEDGRITAEQAELARVVPLADDITAEADSGGHTDRRPLAVLLPEILTLADRIGQELGHRAARVGAAGGIGTPYAAAAAFALGAAYVVTGSVNQACVEADQSDATKNMLAVAGVVDCDMAPSADMFELGAQVQVLRRGTLFAVRARRLRETYRAYDSLEAIPDGERAELERQIFRAGLAEVWQQTSRHFAERDPAQVQRAHDDPKHRMALVFRWYLGLSSRWSVAGHPERVADYQVWCGPAMGAFNAWVDGTYLAAARHRRVAEVAHHLMTGAAFAGRVAQLRLAGVQLPVSAANYLPTPRHSHASDADLRREIR